MENKKITYKEAGVDTKEGERAVSLMKAHVKKTFDENVLGNLGGFGAMYKLPETGPGEPVLVAGTDGVGTKLKLAFLADKHDTVGIDCVAMCVNDILCQGAKPLFFLDYMATGKLEAEKAATIVKGIADGCLLAECALIGGETAEMPGFYGEGEYDIAGFALGLADRNRLITGGNIKTGDIIIGIASSGLHSNGFSLVRRLLEEGEKQGNFRAADFYEELLTPTRIYTKAIKGLTYERNSNKPAIIKGLVHITGGGFYENIPRVLPPGISARLKGGAWEMPEIFRLLKKTGNLDDQDMYATFNMGIGMVVFADPKDGDEILRHISQAGEKGWIIGETKQGSGVEIC